VVGEVLEESFHALFELQREEGISLGEIGEIEGVFSQGEPLVLDDGLYQLEGNVTVWHLEDAVKSVRFIENLSNGVYIDGHSALFHCFLSG